MSIHTNPLTQTSALYFMSAAECPHVPRHELGVCVYCMCVFTWVFMYRGPAASPKPRFSPRCFLSHTCTSLRPPLAPSADGECCHCGSQIYTHPKKRTNHSFVVWGIAHTLTHQSSPRKPSSYTATVRILSVRSLMELLYGCLLRLDFIDRISSK